MIVIFRSVQQISFSHLGRTRTRDLENSETVTASRLATGLRLLGSHSRDHKMSELFVAIKLKGSGEEKRGCHEKSPVGRTYKTTFRLLARPGRDWYRTKKYKGQKVVPVPVVGPELKKYGFEWFRQPAAGVRAQRTLLWIEWLG